MTDKEKTELQEEIVQCVLPESSGRMLLSPRSGKTNMIIKIIKRDKPKKILWVTPTSKLANEDIPEEFVKWKAKTYLKKLVTCTWKSLKKVEGEFCLIVWDEEQYATEGNTVNFFNGKIKYSRLLSMTGKVSTSLDKKEIYEKLNLKVLYELSMQKAVSIGLLANYEMKVVIVELDRHNNIRVDYKCKKTGVAKHFMTSQKNQYDYIDRMAEEKRTNSLYMARMNFIKKSVDKLNATKYIYNSLRGKRILFAPNSLSAETITNNTYHGKTDDKKLKEFMSGEIDNIAMVNKGGTGYTFVGIEHLILGQVDSDTNGGTSQKIARTLLSQGDYKACIWVVLLNGTKDIAWFNTAMSEYDKEKIEYIKFKNLNIDG